MKRKWKLLAVLLSVVMMTAALPFSVLAESASLTGPSTVYAGDTINVTFKINGTNMSGFQGAIVFDDSQVSLNSVTWKVGSPWSCKFEKSTGKFTGYDTTGDEKPLSGNVTLFVASFKVKAGLAQGTTVNITVKDPRVTNIVKDPDPRFVEAKPGDKTYSFKIAPPKSGNANLASLSASNATLSPSFSSSTTTYKADVPYETTKLNLSAVAEDSKAKVTISNNSLAVNATTTVKVIVTAENGTQKVYEIKVHRAQDPNYVPSTNADASFIKVDGYQLSPAFSTDQTEYVVWVPTETTSVKVTAGAKDSKASSVTVDGGSDLQIGDNPVVVTVTAEDGVTTKEYTVVVKRAEDHSHDKDKPEVKSDDASLISMEVGGGEISPAVDPDTTEYNVTLPNSVEGFFGNYTLAPGATAEYKENPANLPVGTTDVTLVVTAQDGETQQTYTFHVTREEEIIPEPEPEDEKCDCWTCRNLWWIIAASGGVGAGTGSAITHSSDKKKQEKELDEIKKKAKKMKEESEK